MKADEPRPWTMPLPEFGKHYFGLGRSASYDAAARGDIPAKRVGKKWLGLVRVAEAELSPPPQVEQEHTRRAAEASKQIVA